MSEKLKIKSKKVILVHPVGDTIAFDIFCPKDFKINPCSSCSYDDHKCKYVWESGMLEYYRCTDDLLHTPEYLIEVIDNINKLTQKYGFTVVFKWY